MRWIIALAALGLAPNHAPAADGTWALGSGVHYSRGDYGGPTETRILSVPLNLRYDREPWIVRLTVPYLRISGESDVLPGLGRVARGNRGGAATTSSSASGLGDSTLAATYAAYYNAASRSGLDLTGKLKLATGDESEGLGTGSNDVSLQVDAYRALERFTPFGSFGYTVFGESPLVDLKNVFYGSLGLSRRLGESDTAGFEVDLRQGASPAPAPQRELMGFLTRRIDRLWRAQAYLFKGFADGSPDWGGGISAAYSF